MTPLSPDEAARGRQLANRRNWPAPERGNARAKTHGAYAQVAPVRLDQKQLEIFEAIRADAPLRAPDGDLPAADAVIVRLLADSLCRLDDLARDIRDHGWKDRKSGEARPVVDLERRLRHEAADLAEALGMTPRSRAQLGVDIGRAADLATQMSEAAAMERTSDPPGGAPK